MKQKEIAKPFMMITNWKTICDGDFMEMYYLRDILNQFNTNLYAFNWTIQALKH